MTTYVLALLKFTDRPTYDRYQARFMEVFRKFDGRLLAADERPVLSEGQSDREKIVLMSFPDEAAARRFLDDPAYVEIAKDRHAGADTVAWFVQGFDV
jgi:uncharacterized protein (DUF1330 family)